MHIERIPLPGVGVSYAFTTAQGRRLGVICHLDGHRELIIFDRDDRFGVHDRAVLAERESQHLADLLRTMVTVDHVDGPRSGPTVVRVPVPAGSLLARLRRSELAHRVPSTVSVVAVIRDDRVLTVRDHALHPGDELVVVGPGDEVAALGRELTTGHKDP